MVSVAVEGYEGPLDLLLGLIQKHEIDIFDIPIHFITNHFLQALSEMEQLDLEVGGEFLVMAATLVQIKSKMLLPTAEAEDDEEEQDQNDPREDLIERLLLYQQYKELASELDQRVQLGRDEFARTSTMDPQWQPVVRDSLDIFGLVEAFERVRRRAGFRNRLEVSVNRRSIQEEMDRIAQALKGSKRISFWTLVERDDSGQPFMHSVVGCFLALLELVRRGLIRVRQLKRKPGELIIEKTASG